MLLGCPGPEPSEAIDDRRVTIHDLVERWNVCVSNPSKLATIHYISQDSPNSPSKSSVYSIRIQT